MDPQTPTKQLTQQGLPSLEGDLPASSYLLQMIFPRLFSILRLLPFLPSSWLSSGLHPPQSSQQGRGQACAQPSCGQSHPHLSGGRTLLRPAAGHTPRTELIPSSRHAQPAARRPTASPETNQRLRAGSKLGSTEPRLVEKVTPLLESSSPA